MTQPHHALEHQLIAALETGGKPTLASMGGTKELEASSDTLRHSPLMPVFLRLTLAADTTKPNRPRWALATTLATGARTDLTLLETTSLLTTHATPSSVRDAFCQHTLALAADTTQPPHTRAIALGAALQHATTSETLRYRLLATLTSTTADDDPEYLRHAARIASHAYTAWQPDGLTTLLEQLTGIQRVAVEACVALGLCTLHDALHNRASGTPTEELRAAHRWFAKAHQHHSERPDAILYSIAIRALDAFSQGTSAPDLGDLTSDLTRHATALETWHEPLADLPWAAAHNAHAAAWHALAGRLTPLAASLQATSWYRPEEVIEQELVAALVAAQTLVHTTATGLEVLLAPRICTALRAQPWQGHLLATWLGRHPNHTTKPQIQAALEEAAEPDDETVPVPHPGGAFPPFTSPEVHLLLERGLADAQGAVDWRRFPAIRQPYQQILRQLLLFLSLRLDLTRAHDDGKYLSQINPPPKEGDLQADLYRFLSGTLGDRVAVERSDIAGGRADIYFPVPPHRVVAELKREFSDASFEALQDHYAGQATEYQATDLRLGFLIVLDLTQQHGRPHVTELVRTVHIQRPGETHPRTLTIIKVPGNQQSPSTL